MMFHTARMWFVKSRNLNATALKGHAFPFGLYCKYCLQLNLVDMAEVRPSLRSSPPPPQIHWSIWLVICFVLVINYARYKIEDFRPLELSIVVACLAWVIMISQAVIFKKVLSIRHSLLDGQNTKREAKLLHNQRKSLQTIELSVSASKDDVERGGVHLD
jgi:hypothetical protein